MQIDFRNVVAETPYDAMGREFQETFGSWVNDTELASANDLEPLAFQLFGLRLALAKKYNTFFASQVTANGTKELWMDRYEGKRNDPCYSFAIRNLERTKRFFDWTIQVNHKEEVTSLRRWDTDYADFPTFPVTVTPRKFMPVRSHKYYPDYSNTSGDPFEVRRILYGDDFAGQPVFLFEHPRSRWMKQIRAEATAAWGVAYDSDYGWLTRYKALATFEWLWNWANPFMRSGALTSDALSLVMQKHMGAKTRDFFYHQDCEALLLPLEEYVPKRVNDMLRGFTPTFKM